MGADDGWNENIRLADATNRYTQGTNKATKNERYGPNTITLLVLQMTLLLQIEKIGLNHHIPIIVFTQKKYSM